LPGLVRRLLRYYEPVRLPGFVHHRLLSLDFPIRPDSFSGEPGIPVPVHSVSLRARVCDLAGPDVPRVGGTPVVAFRM
jgi:hypothetical protein